jgi:hypothetical protein
LNENVLNTLSRQGGDWFIDDMYNTLHVTE